MSASKTRQSVEHTHLKQHRILPRVLRYHPLCPSSRCTYESTPLLLEGRPRAQIVGLVELAQQGRSRQDMSELKFCDLLFRTALYHRIVSWQRTARPRTRKTWRKTGSTGFYTLWTVEYRSNLSLERAHLAVVTGEDDSARATGVTFLERRASGERTVEVVTGGAEHMHHCAFVSSRYKSKDQVA